MRTLVCPTALSGKDPEGVPDARAVAWLHDLFELTPLGRETLRAYGLTAIEVATLELVTRTPARPYEEYTSRIAHAPGRPAELARTVKLAYLDDYLNLSPPWRARTSASWEMRL